MVIEMNNLQEFGEKEQQQQVEQESVISDCEIGQCADIPNEFSSSYGGTWNRRASVNIDDLLVDSDSANDEFQKTWNMNYNEAAIYLEEGKNNDKFQYHPKSRDALPAYLIVHNRYFYALDFLASLVLLGLAFVEQPSVALFKVSPGFHASMELLVLSVVSVELCMKLRWMKIKPFLSHTRTIIKLVTLIVMITEALVVLIRLDPHFRVTRALRPIFLIDNHYCGGIRRVIRQILQSLPPIIDMLLLLLFFMLIFSLFGFYLFSPNGEDSYFSSLERSFVSLFVLLTTANFPDVMMPSYSKCRWSAIFFVLFLVIHLYFLMNLMLAVVYETFTRMDKIKFKKLLLHRRVACKHAFRLLVSRNNPSEIKFKHFYGLMRYFKPQATKLEVYLIFKTLDTNESHSLTIEEFHRIYEISQLKWEQKESTKHWYFIIKWKFLQRFFDILRSIVSSVWFEALVNLMITMSLLWQIFSLSIYSLSAETTWDQFFKQSKVMLFFVTFSVVEILLKVVSFGLITYFSSFWNVFDLVVTTASIFGYISNLFGVSVAFVFILRSFRLLKLFQLKKRYRDIMGTFIFIMAKRFGSVAVVVLIVYYFFAIVGMEIFSGVDLRNCCKQTAVEQYFVADSGQKNGYYYLNNFDNIAISFVTLFELMVVNNWFILMDGYAYTTTEWSRLYFMFFYIITMVVVTVVVAFVLDAFLFRIQFKREIGECDEMITAIVCLSNEEITFCTDVADQRLTVNESANYEFVFRGYRMRSRFSFNLKMYEEEVKQWIREANAEEQLDSSFGDSVNSVAKSRRTVSCSY